MTRKKGAGLIPFTHTKTATYFLFHKTFKGRRAGLLVDFGGGSHQEESYQQTAIREFIEETEALFFAETLNTIDEDFNSQITVLANLLHKTQQQHPDWWCSRKRRKERRKVQAKKSWKTFFVEVDHRDLNPMNHAWATDTSNRFVKRRELLWVSADELVNIIETAPEKLWKRVRELDNLKSLVLDISDSTFTDPHDKHSMKS